MKLTRRGFTGASAGLLGATALPLGQALAADASGSGLRFLVVTCYGGWDVTRVFATSFDEAMIDMEATAERGAVGDLSYVAHADRPSVDDYFARFAARSVIFNGILVPSIAHESCLKLVMTGGTGDRSDWPAIIAGEQLGGFALPHLVVQGPSYPGAFGAAVTRTGSSGQLEGLLTGSILDASDLAVGAPGSAAEASMDAYLARRLAAARDGASSSARDEAIDAYLTSLERGGSLKDLANVIDWSSSSDFSSQVKLAVDALRLGISRCATLSFSYYGWDTHTDNDVYQSANFEQLFSGLIDLMDRLEAEEGSQGGSLADETVVVVCSEMGRTPQLNGFDGKDHWPYTSMLVTGPRLDGGRVIGAFDSTFYGERVDRETGELSDKGHDLTVEEVGATLLRLADIDPHDHLTGVEGVTGAIG